MAGLEHLESLIYHENQQDGSMLCAQHALNSLLQGNYFTAADLSDIARNLDELESSYDDDNAGTTSTNMDDTGFFSVQVLDDAVKVWGLNLTRWRSEAMRPYQAHPHTQLAFILNYQQHWFTLRRFGATPRPEDPEDIANPGGHSHWYNLNSFLERPEWVSRLYLGMVLQQAENDGYSVFAVTQSDPSAPLALPKTDADTVASTLPEPTSSSRINPRSFSVSYGTPASSSVSASRPEGLEDEDLELQAALQASLMGGASDDSFPPPIFAHEPSRSLSSPGAGTHTPRTFTDAASAQDLDPVAASRERNRLMLQRMREEQEYAQRELIAQMDMEGGRRRQIPEEDDEAEMMRRAIAESEAMARLHRGDDDDDVEYVDADEGREADVDMDDDDIITTPSPALVPNSYTSTSRSGATTNHTVYDDDDAELQAALKASLEHVPEGWVPPTLEDKPRPRPSPSVALSSTEGADTTTEGDDEWDRGTIPSSDPVEPVETVSVDELRRRRLARFGS